MGELPSLVRLVSIFILGKFADERNAMENQPRNRILAAAKIFLDNPLSSTLFAIDQWRGKVARHTLVFQGISLTLRTRSPDLKVVRACLLGEFDQAITHTRMDARFIVDGGGYLGLVSILFARHFPQAQVVCLEPSSENFKLAQKNCMPYSNITVLKVALGKARGSAILRDRQTGQWGYTITNAENFETELERVTVITLPDLMMRYNVDRIDLLKLDIEGSEYDLFEVAETWIVLCDLMVVELHERIRPGVEALYAQVIANRHNLKKDGEKHISIIDKGRTVCRFIS